MASEQYWDGQDRPFHDHDVQDRGLQDQVVLDRGIDDRMFRDQGFRGRSLHDRAIQDCDASRWEDPLSRLPDEISGFPEEHVVADSPPDARNFGGAGEESPSRGSEVAHIPDEFLEPEHDEVRAERARRLKQWLAAD